MEPKRIIIIKNGTKIDHKWDHSGPGGGEGATDNQQQQYEKVKNNANANNPNMKTLFLKCGAWRAQRLGVYCGFINKCDRNDI